MHSFSKWRTESGSSRTGSDTTSRLPTTSLRTQTQRFKIISVKWIAKSSLRSLWPLWDKLLLKSPNQVSGSSITQKSRTSRNYPSKKWLCPQFSRKSAVTFLSARFKKHFSTRSGTPWLTFWTTRLTCMVMEETCTISPCTTATSQCVTRLCPNPT